ncbi:MAG: hypothetical protein GC172_10945 [Phycisphaera sp.]|nr:hypothetical protein [Phycisphaera sp.]
MPSLAPFTRNPAFRLAPVLASAAESARRSALMLVVAAHVLALVGCSGAKRAEPTILMAPYPTERVWAVVPFANESGVSKIDGASIADKFVSEIEGVDGLRCLPLNRTLAVMQQLGMTEVSDLRQVYTLMRALQADGLVLGTVTDWDPYKPLRFGAAIEVVSLLEDVDGRALDLKELTMPVADSGGGLDSSRVAVSQASRLFDGRNNATLRELERYATGRSDPDSALGTRVYELRLDLFTGFAAYVLVRDLLEQEAARLEVPLPGGRAERPPARD